MANKKDNDTEKFLLEEDSCEALIRKKTELEFMRELTCVQKSSGKNIITEIKKVPKSMLFTKCAVFEVINKSSKTKSLINGLQAEGYLGTLNAERAKLLSGETDSFVSGNNYVKFVKVKM